MIIFSFQKKNSKKKMNYLWSSIYWCTNWSIDYLWWSSCCIVRVLIVGSHQTRCKRSKFFATLKATTTRFGPTKSFELIDATARRTKSIITILTQQTSFAKKTIFSTTTRTLYIFFKIK